VLRHARLGKLGAEEAELSVVPNAHLILSRRDCTCCRASSACVAAVNTQRAAAIELQCIICLLLAHRMFSLRADVNPSLSTSLSESVPVCLCAWENSNQGAVDALASLLRHAQLHHPPYGTTRSKQTRLVPSPRSDQDGKKRQQMEQAKLREYKRNP
jgi:hypothetical protein